MPYHFKMNPICPICNQKKSKNSWHPPTSFNQKIFSYKKCLDCDTIYVFPFPEVTDLEKMYNFDSYYGESYEDLNAKQNPKGDGLELLKSRITEGKILDIGCGMGGFLQRAKNIGFSIFGTEFNDKLIDILKKKNIPMISLHELSLPIYEIFFDAVNLGDVLEHVTDPHQYLTMAVRVLKPKGYLIIKGPLENNNSISLFTYKLYKLMQRMIAFAFHKEIRSIHPPYHITMMSFKGFNRMLAPFPLIVDVSKLYEVLWPFEALPGDQRVRSLVKKCVAKTSIACSQSPIGKKMKLGNRIMILATKSAY